MLVGSSVAVLVGVWVGPVVGVLVGAWVAVLVGIRMGLAEGVLVGMGTVVRVGVAVCTTVGSTIGTGVPGIRIGFHHRDVPSKMNVMAVVMTVMSARALTQSGKPTFKATLTKACPPLESTSTRPL